jgi:hypothetical protein
MTFGYQPEFSPHATNKRHCISAYGEYAAGSDAITNSFLNALYQGQFIDSAMKAEQETKLLATNRLGVYASYGVAYSWRGNPDSLRWGFTIALRDRQSVYGKFSSDAFRLAFEGNRPFRGQTANLDNTRLTYLHWQQLQFEAKYFTPDKRSTATFGFSILNGSQLQEINLSEGRLYTASDGTSLEAAAKGSYYSSDTSNTKMLSRNGSGTCFNFRFSTILGDSASRFRHSVTFAVQDLGYIRWNDQSHIYNVDTSYTFTGVDATQIILNPDDIPGLPESDSLIGTPVRGQVITFLPLGICAGYTLATPWHWFGGVELRLWSYADALPQATLFGGWLSASERWYAKGGIAWGGYAALQVPLRAGWNPGSHFSISAGTLNLLAWLAPKSTHGQGAHLNVSYAF